MVVQDGCSNNRRQPGDGFLSEPNLGLATSRAALTLPGAVESVTAEAESIAHLFEHFESIDPAKC